MKLFLQIAIIVLFAVSNPAFGKPHKSLKCPRVTRNKNVMVLEYDFGEPVIVTEGDFDIVTIKGFKRYSKAGAPVILVKSVEILVPSGMEVGEITSAALDTEQLPDTYRLGHGIKPRRRQPYGEEGRGRFRAESAAASKPDPAIFETAEFWPGKYHELVTVQTNRGYNIAHVNLFPLQYSPKAGKIRMTTKLRLTIRFAGVDSHHRVKPTKNLKKKLRRTIDNPDTMESYDACKAAIGKGVAEDYAADFDGDCIIKFEDFAVMASTWLDGSEIQDLAEMAAT